MNYAQIVEICCRDLRRYLEETIKTTRGSVVSVKLKRLLRVELSPPDRVLYSKCLSRVLHAYRWNETYVIPREDVEKILETFDELCQATKNMERRGEPKPRRERLGEDVAFISVALTYDLLRAVDAYAHLHDMSRSAVIRQAIQQLIEMRRVLEELDRARDGPMGIVALRLSRDLLRDLDERAAELKTTRSALIRYAIHRLIEKTKTEATP